MTKVEENLSGGGPPSPFLPAGDPNGQTVHVAGPARHFESMRSMSSAVGALVNFRR